MGKFQHQGDLASAPLPSLLFHVWKAEHSGSLEIKAGKDTTIIDFKRGNICVCIHSIKKDAFLASIKEKGLLEESRQTKYRKLLKKNDTSFIKALNEGGQLPGNKLWALMNEFVKKSLLPLFDCQQAEFVFHSDPIREEHEILFYIPTLDFILQGIRQMQNQDIISSHIPSPDMNIQPLNPDYLHQIRLNPAEIYIYHVIESHKNLKKIYNASEIGEKESQKIIFSFLSIGIAGQPQTQSQSPHTPEFSQVRLHKLLEAFNTKSSFIFKYISKEIGPAAWSVMGKCIEEIRTHLSPFFHNVRLDAEGRIEADSIQKTGSPSIKEDARKTFLSDLDEILAAEILAVKRTLGNSHEAELVKNLEKIGKWN